MLENLRVPLNNTTMHHLDNVAKSKGIDVFLHSTFIELIRSNFSIRINVNHAAYMIDIIKMYDYYFDAVEPVFSDGKMLVDYSTPRIHRVRGFDLFPVMFNGFAEPIITTTQYTDIAKIPKGGTVLDLGGYSGLTSIIFALEAGRDGKVICVEPDSYNMMATRSNLDYFSRLNQDAAPILLEERAVWTHGEGVVFTSEGNTGSGATDIVKRGGSNLVPSITLSGIAEKYELTRIDFIKCDVEGAEACIFAQEQAFLRKYRPRMIIEPHYINEQICTPLFLPHLHAAGYIVHEIEQYGVTLPLIVALPMS